jgi:hypothetical protein
LSLERKPQNRFYSCADICWSVSRQALIFKRRQTQQRSSSAGWGPVSGVQEAPHTAHRFAAMGRSPSTDFLAISNISGEIIGSAIGFFFILVFTIEQIGYLPSTAFSIS